MKDAGGVDSPTTPTTNNFITLNRYHVRYIRADGRNTPGVDVPYPFDGAFTATVRHRDRRPGSTLVRIQAKAEAPLAALARNFLVDLDDCPGDVLRPRPDRPRGQRDRPTCSVNFANFGDPGIGRGRVYEQQIPSRMIVIAVAVWPAPRCRAAAR